MTLCIHLLGEFVLELHGRTVPLGSRKAEAIFAYLVMQARPLSRETLATIFWDDSDPDQALANLRKLLSSLRQPLADYLLIERQTVEFNRRADYWLDVAEFIRLLQPPKTTPTAVPQMQSALALYRDHFLADIRLPEADDFAAWLLLERERYRRQFADGLRTLVQHSLQERAYDTGIVYAHRLLVLDPLSEHTHRQLMLLLARSGQTEAAIAQYHICRHTLAAELGVEPTPATTALFTRLETAVAHPTHLPDPTDSFIGRETELAHIHHLLNDPACRLLTLLGPGGIGKTRLALHAAAERTIDYVHGVHFVSLTAVDSSNALVTAVADALNLSLAGPASPAQQLLAALQSRELLLVLDNCETLFQLEAWTAVDVLADLLQHAPQVQLLATSRERFNFQAEQVLPLTGLLYPSEGTEPTTTNPAIRLFAERAKTAVPTFTLTATNLPYVAHICRLVDGVPLALELAAALLPRHSTDAIAAAITRSLDFLADDVTRPDRHASLRAVFESSWAQLLPAEQATFCWLSVFRSSFTAEAATAVAQASYQDLLGLVDKSFLRLGDDGRYTLHEVLRHYAAGKLAADKVGDLVAAADRHADFFCHFLEIQGAALNGPLVGLAQVAVRHELENGRQAWHWAVQGHQWPQVARALPGLSRYYQLHGPFAEGVVLFGQAINALSTAPDQTAWSGLLAECVVQTAVFHNEQAAYDQALIQAQAALNLAAADTAVQLTAVQLAARVEMGRAQVGLGEYETAVPHLQALLETLQQQTIAPLSETERHNGAADILRVCGMAAHYQGQYGRAHELFSQAHQLARQIGNRWLESGLLNNLGVVSKTLGNLAAARTYYEQNLQMAADIGDQRGLSKTLINLGSVLRSLGHAAGARAAYEEALHLKREMGDRQGESLALNNLGNVAALLGDYAGAQAYFGQALTLFREIGRRRDEGMVLSNCGLLAHLRGDAGTAVRYSQEALVMARAIGDRSTEAYALTHLGHGLLGQGQLAEAAAAYQQSCLLRQEMGETLMGLESQAGLAQVRLAEGKVAAALVLVEPILPCLEKEEMGVGEQPFQVYLTCYEVLLAHGDGRAATVLTQAHNLLLKQAAQLEDAATRHTFLHQVAVHRAVVTAVKNSSLCL